jgi:hypothetical protein
LCGAAGFSVHHASELEGALGEALGEALACPGPSLVHIHADVALI